MDGGFLIFSDDVFLDANIITQPQAFIFFRVEPECLFDEERLIKPGIKFGAVEFFGYLQGNTAGFLPGGCVDYPPAPGGGEQVEQVVDAVKIDDFFFALGLIVGVLDVGLIRGDEQEFAITGDDDDS